MRATTSGERRDRTRQLIDRLLAERRQMLVLLCRLSGLKPFSADKGTAVKGALEEFCQILVDYIAAAHFGVYQRIADGSERRQSVMELARLSYPRISRTTQAAVDFNERYDSSDHELCLETLEADLSRLGEEIATRIELEDQLIAVLADRSAATPT